MDAIPALLAFSAGLRVDQLGDDSVDQLVDGASSRRNQVLMDLGRELGIGAVDGVHEVPRPSWSPAPATTSGATATPARCWGP